MKVLYIAHSAKIGGATRSLLYMCKEIPGSSVVFPYKGPVIREFSTAGVSHRVLRVPSFFYYQYKRFSVKQAVAFLAFAWNIPRLIRLIVRERIQILHFNEIVLAPAAAILKTLLRRHVKTVMHVRALLPRPMDSLMNRLIRGLVQMADYLICIGPNEAEGYREERRAVLYNPVDFGNYVPAYRKTPYLHRRFAINEETTLAGVFAQIGIGKGHRLLLECGDTLEKLDLKVILFGDGPLRSELQTAVREHGLDTRILFAGAVSNVFECMEGCDFIIRLEEYGYFGRDILEANALGVPVLTTKNRLNVDDGLVRPGVNGYTFPPGNDRELVRLLPVMTARAAAEKRKPGPLAEQTMASAYGARIRDIYDELESATG